MNGAGDDKGGASGPGPAPDLIQPGPKDDPVKEETAHGTRPTSLDELRFDYAWKWFSFHAEQRTKVFNFMLIALGLLTTAVTGLIGQRLIREAGILCGIGVVICVIFFQLDRRNRMLVRRGEAKLEELEKGLLFGSIASPNQDDKGILWQAPKPSALKSDTEWWRKIWEGQHRFWFPLTACLIGFSFAVAAFYLFAVYTPGAPSAVGHPNILTIVR